jgi:hypothetical protein
VAGTDNDCVVNAGIGSGHGLMTSGQQSDAKVPYNTAQGAKNGIEIYG